MSDITLAEIRILKEEAEQKILDIIKDFEETSDLNIEYVGLEKEPGIAGTRGRGVLGLTLTCYPF